MRGVTPGLVDEVWGEITAYPPDRVAREAGEFLERQPHVAAFAGTLTRELDPPVQQAALGLCYLLFKILERSLGRPFPALAADRIEGAYADLLERVATAHPAGVGDVAALLEGDEHPTLVGYVLTIFYGGNAALYDERVRAGLTLLLRTLSRAVDLGAVEG